MMRHLLKRTMATAVLGGAAWLLAGCSGTDPGPSDELLKKQVEYQKSQVPGGGGKTEAEARAQGKP